MGVHCRIGLILCLYYKHTLRAGRGGAEIKEIHQMDLSHNVQRPLDYLCDDCLGVSAGRFTVCVT